MEQLRPLHSPAKPLDTKRNTTGSNLLSAIGFHSLYWRGQRETEARSAAGSPRLACLSIRLRFPSFSGKTAPFPEKDFGKSGFSTQPKPSHRIEPKEGADRAPSVPKGGPPPFLPPTPPTKKKRHKRGSPLPVPGHRRLPHFSQARPIQQNKRDQNDANPPFRSPSGLFLRKETEYKQNRLPPV